MSERLTHSVTASKKSWNDLAMPGALALVAGFVYQYTEYVPGSVFLAWFKSQPVHSTLYQGISILFALLCADIVRGMLPTKAPESHKAFTASMGAVASTPLLVTGNLGLLIIWTFALAAWTFFQAFPESVPARILSGLCAGVAICLGPETLLVSIPLLTLNTADFISHKKKSLLRVAAWDIGVLLGVIPLLTGAVSTCIFAAGGSESLPLGARALSFLGGIPLLFWPFFMLGLGVGLFQARKTVVALLLPLLIGIPVASAFWKDPERTGMNDLWPLPVTLLSAYGLYRIVRGAEQGVRNSSPSKAKKVVPISTLLVLFAYAIWLAIPHF